MRTWLAAGIVGFLFNIIAGSNASGPPPWMYLAGAVLTSGIIQVWLNQRDRRRTGEGESSAADSVARGAEANARASESLIAPLERQITQLIERVTDLENLNEDLRAENQDLHRELADITREAALLAQDALRARQVSDARIAELEEQLRNALAIAGRLERRAGGERRTDGPDHTS